MTSIEKIKKLDELRQDRALASQAMRDIASGKKQSYGVGTRNAAAYNMSLGELRAWKKELDQQIAELEADIAGKTRRPFINFIPRY